LVSRRRSRERPRPAARLPRFRDRVRCSYNMRMAIPRQIEGQKYISLTTFRKNGVAVPTPVWFGEESGKLYVVSEADSGKCKRLRNNSNVRIAPCTIRGKITGPEFEAIARILPPSQSPQARASVRRKYWLARIPSPWRKNNVYLEIDVAAWNSLPAKPGAP
jgi:PPOX class probable F420-dependent enzyme